MISVPTVLVLGAGASKPYGFPTGRELLLTVVSGLSSPGHQLYLVINGQLGYGEDTIESFRQALRRSSQPSVDAFLEKRRDFLELGKATIAASLIPREDPSEIDRNESLKWYEYLFSRLDTSTDGFSNNRLSVITFNYDRSLEYFMHHALKDSNGLSDEATSDLLSSMPIIHVHGQIGRFSVSEADGHRLFEDDLRTEKLRTAIEGIKVLHETEQSSPEFARARELISGAEVICFLGFGYLETNINRLGVKELVRKKVDLRKPPHFFGTAHGLGMAEKETVLVMVRGNIELGTWGMDALDFLKNYAVFR